MFRKILAIIFTLLWAFIPFSQIQAQSFNDWQINAFDSQIQINEDGSMVVTERIDAEFFIEKRGIFREIPYEYYDDFRQASSIDIDVLDVTNGEGESWEYKTTYSGGYLNIRIGNPEVYLDGEQTYIISYEVERALSFYDSHQELYWDVTGNDWFIPIANTSASVILPSTGELDIQTRCFTGEFGSVESNCQAMTTGNIAQFSADDFLTIVVGWPKGIVQEPSDFDKFLLWIQNNWAFSLPLITFFFMMWVWNKYGKDPEDPPGLVVQFDPPEDLTPAEVGYLVSQSLKKSYLPAELVNLASKGYIHIKEKMGKKSKEVDDYILIKKKEPDEKLKQHEKLIMKGIFLAKKERKLSQIPTSFYGVTNKIKKSIYKQLKAKKYFQKDPQAVRNSWLVLAVFLIFASFFTLAAPYIHYFVGIMLSGVIVFLFSFIMSRRTKNGVLAYEHALGFKEYIEIAEDRRVKWEEEENLFFQFLPYAMVFGIADKWSRAFKDVFKDIPEWYEGDLTNLNATSFTKNMHLFSRTTTSNIRPPQSSGGGYSRSSSSSFSSGSSGFSSGGGFSGGGGGGGGGGSW